MCSYSTHTHTKIILHRNGHKKTFMKDEYVITLLRNITLVCVCVYQMCDFLYACSILHKAIIFFTDVQWAYVYQNSCTIFITVTIQNITLSPFKSHTHFLITTRQLLCGFNYSVHLQNKKYPLWVLCDQLLSVSIMLAKPSLVSCAAF